MTRRGASSESLTIKVDTDLGPRVSLLLNSLLLRSLPYHQRCTQLALYLVVTSGSLPQAGDSRIVPQESAETPPLAPPDAQSMIGSELLMPVPLRRDELETP